MKSSKIKGQERQLELFLVIAGLALVLILPALIVRSQGTSDAALNAVRASAYGLEMHLATIHKLVREFEPRSSSSTRSTTSPPARAARTRARS